MTAPLPPALFIGAHPDDLTLTWLRTIRRHLVLGQEVYFLLITEGRASDALEMINGTKVSGVYGGFHNPNFEGYFLMSESEFGAARVTEEWTALETLASPPSLGLGLSGNGRVAGLPDGLVTTAGAKAAILDLCRVINPGGPVRLKGHTYVTGIEPHPDHRAVGNALKELAAEYPTLYGDVRFGISPAQWQNPNLSNLVPWHWDLEPDANEQQRLRFACRAGFQTWAPAVNRFAIGLHSVPTLWPILDATPRSMYHPLV